MGDANLVRALNPDSSRRDMRIYHGAVVAEMESEALAAVLRVTAQEGILSKQLTWFVNYLVKRDSLVPDASANLMEISDKVSASEIREIIIAAYTINADQKLTTPESEAEHTNRENLQEAPRILKKLGYQAEYDTDGAVLITLPDRKAVVARWDRMRTEDSKLPDLSIGTCDGIADDIDFIEAHFSNDALLSSGPEFVHDQLIHLVPMLRDMAFKGFKQEYSKEKLRLVKIIIGSVRRIERAAGKTDSKTGRPLVSETHLEQLKTTLGGLVDAIFSQGHKIKTYNQEHFYRLPHSFWTNESNKPLWERRFKKQKLTGEHLAKLQDTWENMGRLDNISGRHPQEDSYPFGLPPSNAGHFLQLQEATANIQEIAEQISED